MDMEHSLFAGALPPPCPSRWPRIMTSMLRRSVNRVTFFAAGNLFRADIGGDGLLARPGRVAHLRCEWQLSI